MLFLPMQNNTPKSRLQFTRTDDIKQKQKITRKTSNTLIRNNLKIALSFDA
jgi:hypothetical protein